MDCSNIQRSVAFLAIVTLFVAAAFLWHHGLRVLLPVEHLADDWFRRDHLSAKKTKLPSDPVPVIAVGGGITSVGVGNVNLSTADFVAKFTFFATVLPSFCSTASVNFQYRFYFAYDFVDPVFSSPDSVVVFRKTFASESKKRCLEARGIQTSLRLIECFHVGKPTYAQNDAMIEAYLDSVDYFYRINDDTQMVTADWANEFVRVLKGYDPPMIGVTGPNHKGGNEDIMTHDFVHRTHIDIFGYYYPRVFTDWWADNWITDVYKPRRSAKLQHVTLLHTMSLGQRYRETFGKENQLGEQLKGGRNAIRRYVEAARSRSVSGISSEGRRVISMSLFGRQRRHTWGAVRNAQLVPVHFPGWRLRVFVSAFSPSTPDELLVPVEVVNKLRQLGAHVTRVHCKPDRNGTSTSRLAPRDWRLLAADDPNVDYFLIRDVDDRLNDHDALAVNQWIAEVSKYSANSSNLVFPVHIIRYNPTHSVVDGRWGGRPRALRHRLGTTLTAAYNRKLSAYSTANANGSDGTNVTDESQSALEEVLRPLLSETFVHDVVLPQCDRRSTHNALRMSPPTIRHPLHVDTNYGRKYDEHEELLPTSGDYLIPSTCT